MILSHHLITDKHLLPRFKLNPALMAQYLRRQDFCVDIFCSSDFKLFFTEFISQSRPPFVEAVLWFDWLASKCNYRLSVTDRDFLMTTLPSKNTTDYFASPKVDFASVIGMVSPIIKVPIKEA